MYLRISRVKFRSWAIKTAALLAVAGIGARLFLFPTATQAAWFDDNYAYRQMVTIGNSGSADSNKKIKFDVDTATLITAGKMQSTCADTRFTDGNGKVLQYYIDSANGACNTNSTDYYVLIPTINGSSNATYIFMYYGYASAAPGTQPSQLAATTFSPTSGPSFASEEKGVTPLLYWKFDEGNQTTANDSSAKSNSGTISGAAWQSEDQCIRGKCLKFDGSTSGVTRAYSSDTELTAGTGSLSVSSWFRHGTTISAVEYILHRTLSAGRGAQIGYIVYLDATGKACADITDDTYGVETICSTGTYIDNKWHFIEFVKNSTTSITLYVDGNKVAEDTSLSVVTAFVDADFTVGKDGNTSTAYWNGFIDEVKVFGYAKSAAQVLADYNAYGTDSEGAALGASDQKSLSNGLVGYWKLDENSGTSTADSSGNGFTATLTNSPAWSTQGRFGSGVSFDGASASDSDVIDVGDQSALELTTFTISGWVYRTGACSFSICPIFSKGMSGNSGYSLEVADVGGIYKATLNIGDNNQVVAGTTTIATNTWYHVTATANGNRIKIYVNGTLETDEAQTQTPSFGTEPAKIGNRNDNNDVTFNGRIDDVRVYNRELSSIEVRALSEYSAGPAGWWKLDEKSGSSAQDSSGNGYTGTLTNGPKWSNGKVGGALSFDNSDDYVNMGDNLDLSTKNFTILAWAKRTDHSSGDVIVAKKNGGGSGNSGYAIYCTTNTTCTAYLADGSAEFTVSGTMGTAEQWHFVAVVVDRSANSATKFYSDGIETTTSRSGTISTLGSVGTTASLRIGRYSNSTFPFNGQIDNVKIYDYALTQKQIVSEMNAGHPAVGSPISSAIGYWKFDEGADNTCSGGSNDVCNSGSAGTAIDGAESNMAVPGTSTSGWTTNGKLGRALIFDGSNDQVDMGTSSTLNITGQSLTFSSWVKRASSTQGGVLASRGTAGSNGYAIGIGNIQGSGCTTHQIAIGKFGTSFGCLSSFPADTNWHHLVVTLNSSGERAYVDGSLVASNTDTGSIATSSNNFRLGIGTDGASLFAGSMDEVKVYNYDLSADDVKIEYNQGKVQVLGSVSTESDGTSASNATTRSYCVPGDTTSCISPVGEWYFDEGQGTTANDQSSNGNNLTLNISSWSTGKYGKSFNGTGGTWASEGADDADFDFAASESFTTSLWFKSRSATNPVSGNEYLIAKGGNNNIGWYIRANSTGEIIFATEYTGDGNSDDVVNTNNADKYDGTWHHLAAVKTGTTKMELYIDGALVDTDASITNSSLDTAQPLIIGDLNASDNGNEFNGDIDMVRIYRAALTPAQIAWEYNRGGPVGWWKFDECQGTTAYDASGNGWNGTITTGASGTHTSAGTCSSGTSSEAWNSGTIGKYNTSLGFDGTNDYVDVGDHDILNDISISAWVYWNAATANDGIISKRTGNEVAGDWSLRMDPSGTGTLEWMIWSGLDSSKNAFSISPLGTGAWHHIAVTFSSSSNTAKIYIDGKLDATDTTITNDLADTPETIKIGAAGQSSDYFDGKIDDVRMYNYVLTDAQIKTIYNNNSAVRFGPETGSP